MSSYFGVSMICLTGVELLEFNIGDVLLSILWKQVIILFNLILK